MLFRSPDARFLALTAALVVLLGTRSAMDLFAEEGPVRAEAAMLATPRTPASLAPRHVPRPALPSGREALLTWDCGHPPKSGVLAVKGDFRLKGRGCGKNFVAERLEIINETNGFTASVFAKGDEAYETDLIPVVQGRNSLKLRYLSAQGPAIETVLHVMSSLQK